VDGRGHWARGRHGQHGGVRVGAGACQAERHDGGGRGGVRRAVGRPDGQERALGRQRGGRWRRRHARTLPAVLMIFWVAYCSHVVFFLASSLVGVLLSDAKAFLIKLIDLFDGLFPFVFVV